MIAWALARIADVSIPRWAWEALAAVAALAAVWFWHDAKVHAAYEAGSAAQLAADSRAVTRAFVRANAEQHRAVVAERVRLAANNERAEHANAAKNDDIDRALAARKLRRASAAAAGRAVEGGAATGPGSAGEPDDAATPRLDMVEVEADDVAAAAKDAAQLEDLISWARGLGR